MNNEMRHFITILKEIEAIKEKLERSYTPELESDYQEACNMRNLMFVELLRIGYPFISLPDEDVVRINIDEKNYDISRLYLRSFLGEEECDKILSQTSFNLDNDNNLSKEQSESYDKEFDQLKERINNNAFSGGLRQQYENNESLNSAPVMDYFINKNGHAKRINTTEFAFMGLQHGVGTTHTAIMFAQTLALDDELDVAYFEANDSGAISRLVRWHTGQDALTGFPLKNVDFYYGMDYLTFVAKYKDMYDYVIVDFGMYSQENDINDFIRIPIKFVICSGIDWNLPILSDFYNTFKYDAIHGITYLVPFFSSSDDIGYIKNIAQQNNTLNIPFNLNPFEPSEEIVDTFKELIGINSNANNINEEKSSSKKLSLKSLFKKLKNK